MASFCPLIPNFRTDDGLPALTLLQISNKHTALNQYTPTVLEYIILTRVTISHYRSRNVEFGERLSIVTKKITDVNYG